MRLSAGSRSPGDGSEQTQAFVTSQLSASELTLEWPGPRAVNGATKTTKHSYGISNWLAGPFVQLCGFKKELVQMTESI